MTNAPLPASVAVQGTGAQESAKLADAVGNSPVPPGVDTETPARSGPVWTRLKAGEIAHAYGLIFAWIAVIALFGILRPGEFLTTANLANILGSQAVIAVLTLGVLIPMTTGDFDLSIASVLTLSAMITAVLNVNAHWAIVPSMLVAVSAGTAIGFFNGCVTTWLGIDPFIVTLGSGTVANGLTLWISQSNTISGLSQGLVNDVVGRHLLGVPIEFYYGLALCVVLWLVFEFTRAGRLLLIVGQGRAVARLSGIRVSRVRVLALTASAFVAAWAGVLYAGTSGAADPTSGTQLMLPAFAGAFLGATAIKPGRFNAWGSLVAVYFLVTGVSGLQMLGVADYVQDLFYGGALVIAVGLSQLSRRRQLAESAVH
jgi:ribose transport system permease protein